MRNPSKIKLKAGKRRLLSTAAAFFLTFFFFCLITGWPESLPHLTFLIVISWLISVGLLDPELKTKLIPTAATLCALVFLSGFLIWQRPWEEKGKIWINYDAAFFYLENSPVDNVSIELPLPVRGENVMFKTINWGICWQNPYRMIYRQMGGYDNLLTSFWELRGERTENVMILDWKKEGTQVKYKLDRIYPNEIFVISASEYVWARELGKITCRKKGENPRASFYSPRVIKVRFWVELTKMTKDGPKLIEAFLSESEGQQENLELLPTENTFWQFFITVS
jgi:hypothetical protein